MHIFDRKNSNMNNPIKTSWEEFLKSVDIKMTEMARFINVVIVVILVHVTVLLLLEVLRKGEYLLLGTNNVAKMIN